MCIRDRYRTLWITPEAAGRDSKKYLETVPVGRFCDHGRSTAGGQEGSGVQEAIVTGRNPKVLRGEAVKRRSGNIRKKLKDSL